MMKEKQQQTGVSERLLLESLPVPAKALVTAIILTLGLAMVGALGQIIIHDIIPTFFSNSISDMQDSHHSETPSPDMASAHQEDHGRRGDLFSEEPLAEEVKPQNPFYKSDQFVWSLKWTHIHLFGINMIFIILGGITLLLNMSSKFRTWLIVLPFIGILIDISALWLKGFVSPVFFWLHIPGGNLFVTIFAFVSIRALWEMWMKKV